MALRVWLTPVAGATWATCNLRVIVYTKKDTSVTNPAWTYDEIPDQYQYIVKRDLYLPIIKDGWHGTRQLRLSFPMKGRGMECQFDDDNAGDPTDARKVWRIYAVTDRTSATGDVNIKGEMRVWFSDV